MNAAQLAVFWEKYAVEWFTRFNHGDCVGADADAHRAFRLFAPSTKIIIHPPLKEDLRAFCEWDEILPQKSHFARNRTIVNCSDMLVITPWQDEWQNNGGTWYTHDYALKQGKPVHVIFPNGTIDIR